MSSGLESFIGLYPVHKTLRFELVPQGETQEWIERNGALDRDKMLARDYELVKSYIDEYHRSFISSVLGSSEISIDWTELADAIDAFQVADADGRNVARARLGKVQAKYREAVVLLLREPGRCGLDGHPGFRALFTADFIKKVLPAHYADKADKASVILGFGKSAAYFNGFFDNRKFMYSSEDKVGSIAHRVVNQNFPMFYQNVKVYRTLKEAHPELLASCEAELEKAFGEFGMDTVFDLGFFNRVLSQEGIDFYNAIIGGVAKESGPHVRGLNQRLKEASQQCILSECVSRLRFAKLYKQILAESETLSFVLGKVDNDGEATSMVLNLYAALGFGQSAEGNAFCRLAKLFEDGGFDLSKVYVPAVSIPALSSIITGDWSAIPSALDTCESELAGPAQGLRKPKAQSWRKSRQFSIAEISLACSAAGVELPDGILPNVAAELKDRLQMADELRGRAIEVCRAFKSVKRLLLEDNAGFEPIKEALDALLGCNDVIKLFNVDRELDRDAKFYAVFEEMYERTRCVAAVYSKLRNYITQNPYSEEKFKLNFDTEMLAAGWDIGREERNRCSILLKDGLYYLAVMGEGEKRLFSNVPNAKEGQECYRKMVYKLIPGPNKILPKVFFSKKGKKTFEPSGYILEGYEAGKHKKGDAFDLKFCHDLIDFFKEGIGKYPGWEVFDFNFSDTLTYDNIGDFYREVAQGGYSVRFVDIPSSYVEGLVAEGKLYLFQIYCKDFSKASRGRKNLHTLYFDCLFDEENLREPVFKLDGGAELFYRPASIKKPYAHRAGEKLVNKTYRKDGKVVRIPDDAYVDIVCFVNGQKEREELCPEASELIDSGKAVIKDARYDIVKDRRYTQAKYGFHVPITINFRNSGLVNINHRALEYLHRNPDVNIVGINRGERNLIYVTVINQRGEIIEQRSLNVINGVDYRAKLVAKEQERVARRRNWKRVGQIAKIKEGYLSLAVAEIAKMMIEHSAILVLEDLSTNFKGSRVHIEKQVYQKFERALLEKLNYLAKKPGVDPDAAGTGIYEPGGIARGYQLANKFEGFADLGRQSGLVFYVSPWNISNLDPTTGFANLFPGSLLAFTNVEESKGFFGSFNRIAYSPDDDCFEFGVTYSKFKQIKQRDYTDTWVVCSYGSRIARRRSKKTGRWSFETVDITGRLKALLDGAGIEYESGRDICGDICLTFDRGCFIELYGLFKLVVQLRNVSIGSDNDYVLSPVRNASGYFYDSRYADSRKLPREGDANGAFNIARKGLKLLQEINASEPGDDLLRLPPLSKGENDRWLQWAQKNVIW